MTRQEIIDKLRLLSRDEQILWMRDLGYSMTVSARDCYAFQEKPGDVKQLMGFNELQHAVYGRIAHLSRGDDWTDESFVDGLLAKAKYYGVEGGLGWAIKSSLQRFDKNTND